MIKLTIGELIDKLTICNIRIWNCEDIKRDPNSTDKEIADAHKITNIENDKRNKIIQAIDEEIYGENIYKTGDVKLFRSKKK